MKDYYIGLDVGTDSVGWAVTDKDYNLLKFKGNSQWGIRLLEESNVADERRAFRSARRRLQRKKFRISCLETLFDKEISKIDVAFFQRLHESNWQVDDKGVEGRYSLFNDEKYTDVDYHKQFPTIYHLRKHLIESNNPVDARLVYLAVSHIIKNRGHFLFDSDLLGGSSIPAFQDAWNSLSVFLKDEMGICLDCKDISLVQDIFKSNTMSITAKKNALADEFSITKKDEPQYSLISLLAGATVNAAVLFDDEELKSTEAAKIVFTNGFDEKSPIYESVLGDRFELISKLKAVYDWAILAEILRENKYLSYAKCEVYDEHKSDLKQLKKYVKSYIPEKYNLIFNENDAKLKNYCSYSGHFKKSALEKKCEQQEFLDFLKKQLPKEPADEEYALMYNKIVSGKFMPKIISKDNALIPMQVNKAELITILNNASNYLSFLNDVDSNGKSVKDKIIDIFSFRIPYYVGPLNTHSDKSWLERTNEKIYPWNFEKVVDVEKSAEKFIENLTSKCTYISTANVIPKNSLLYSKFTVLNELNNLKIDGEPITVELKQKIYNDLFLKYNKVTFAKVKNYLNTDAEITGIDGDFKSHLKPFRQLAPFDLTDAEKEEIIKDITIFGDDKKLLKKRLSRKFGEKLSADDILKLSKLKFSDWGRLSKQFLEEVFADCKDTGEVQNIIGFMWNTNCNLMQLLSKDYGFVDAIKQINGEDKFTSLKSEIDALYVSPKVKRPIYQAMQIVEELVKINGCEPKKIFVEVARGKEDTTNDKNGGRKASRKDRLIELYKSCKKDNLELYESLLDREENEFRRDALYLYYTQFGKCMYTGKDIPIESIFNKNLYDIDHIFPQSKIKDDSLDNRVLVTKKSNEDKGNVYPIPQNVRDDRKEFWQLLLSKGMINQKKYDRLVRNYPLTEDELSAFINRQIVETRQSTKAIAQLLEKRYSSKVVYVKAGLVSNFRHSEKFDFVKCRDINDFHHAKDAYLNIVVGNVYNTRFTQKYFIRDLSDGTVSLNKMFDFNTENAWVTSGENNSTDIVKKTMSKNNIRFTRYSYKQKGGLFDQTLQKKGKGQVSLKGKGPLSNIDKYGGYDKAKSTFFAFVSYVNPKGEIVKQFIPIDLYKEKDYLENPKAFIDKQNAIDCTVIIPCVKYNALVSLDGFRMHISSKTGLQIRYKPAMQLVLDAKFERYIKKIRNYLDKCVELNEEKPVTEFDGITFEDNIKLYDALSDKLNNTIFNVKFGTIAEMMLNKKAIFEMLSLKGQCDVLMQILNILHTNARLGNLTLLKEGSQSGAVQTNSKISPSKNIKSFKIINQSITGLFEQETELLD